MTAVVERTFILVIKELIQFRRDWVLAGRWRLYRVALPEARANVNALPATMTARYLPAPRCLHGPAPYAPLRSAMRANSAFRAG